MGALNKSGVAGRILMVSTCLICASSCRTTYKSHDQHERDSLDMAGVSVWERLGWHWSTWERYDSLGRVVERATTHSEERTQRRDSVQLRQERSTSASTKTQSTPASSSPLAILKWLAFALLVGISLGIYGYRRLRL